MAKKHLSEDEIKYIISADSSKAQQAIHQLGKSTASLRREEKARRSALIEMEATGKKNTDQYRKLKEEIKNYSKQISDNEAQMRKLRSTLDTSAMSMNQLRRYAKELATELDNTSRAASPQQFNDLQKRLASVNLRMEELRTSSMKLRFGLNVNRAMSGCCGHRSASNFRSAATESSQRSALNMASLFFTSCISFHFNLV